MLKGKDKLCVIKIGGAENTFAIDSECDAEKEEERYAFAITNDDDGEYHIGVKLSEKELEDRMNEIRYFYEKGMIPWICPSCGKLWGGSYDAGSIRWFACKFCKAKWEMINGEEVDKHIDKEKRKLKIRVIH